MSSNEEHTSLRLWCAEGKKYRVCGGFLGCDFTRGVLKHAEGLGQQSGEMGWLIYPIQRGSGTNPQGVGELPGGVVRERLLPLSFPPDSWDSGFWVDLGFLPAKLFRSCVLLKASSAPICRATTNLQEKWLVSWIAWNHSSVALEKKMQILSCLCYSE